DAGRGDAAGGGAVEFCFVGRDDVTAGTIPTTLILSSMVAIQGIWSPTRLVRPIGASGSRLERAITLREMFDQLADLEAELDRLEARLPEIYASGDRRASAEAGRRHAELRPVVEAYRAWRKASGDLTDAQDLLEHETDGEMRAYLRGEITEK